MIVAMKLVRCKIENTKSKFEVKMEIKQNHIYMKISILNVTQRHDSKETSGSFFNL